MAHMKQTARKGNKGLLKATDSRKSCGGGGGSGCGSGGGGGSDGNGNGNGNGGNGDGKGNIPGGRLMEQLEHRPPPAVQKWKKPYVRAFREMKNYSRLRSCVYQSIRWQGE